MRGPNFQSSIARFILQRWVTGNRSLLQDLQSEPPSGETLLQIAESWKDDPDASVQILHKFIDLVRVLTAIPVVFIIDQNNALCKSRSKVDDGSKVDDWEILCQSLSDINTFGVRHGIVFYAYSSSFDLMPGAKDGLSEAVLVLEPNIMFLRLKTRLGSWAS